MGLRRPISRLFLGAIAVGLSACATATAAETLSRPEPEEIWQAIYLGGQRVGTAQILVKPVQQNGTELVETETKTQISLKRFGQVITMRTILKSQETLSGDLQSYTFQMANPPASSSSTVGTVQGDSLQLVNEVDGRKSQSSTPWKAGIKSPTFQDRILREQALQSGEKRQYEVFFPEFSKPGKLYVAAGDREKVALLDGKAAELQRLTVSNSLMPGISTSVWVNETGESLKSSTSMLGTEMVTYVVSQAEALKELSVVELDLGVATLVKTRAIPRPYDTRRVTYRITMPQDDPSMRIPAGDSQAVARVSDHVADVTVTALEIPQNPAISSPGDEFLEASRYVQWNDSGVQQHADAAAKSLTDPGAVARAMEAYVHHKLAKKNFSTALASAGEVARNLEGDCTEHAVLLAAMLRARQIPSRVVVGLVYVESSSAFGGHMWTEAYLGNKWVPLDATLGRGGIGATHVKLGDASFSDAAGPPLNAFSSLITVIGTLQIDVRSAE